MIRCFCLGDHLFIKIHNLGETGGVGGGSGGSHFTHTELPEVINMAKKNRTENLYPVPGSIFLEYAWSNNHFAISLQKTSVFYEKLYFWSLTNFKKCVFFSFFFDMCQGSKILFFVKNWCVLKRYGKMVVTPSIFKKNATRNRV